MLPRPIQGFAGHGRFGIQTLFGRLVKLQRQGTRKVRVMSALDEENFTSLAFWAIGYSVQYNHAGAAVRLVAEGECVPGEPVIPIESHGQLLELLEDWYESPSGWFSFAADANGTIGVQWLINEIIATTGWSAEDFAKVDQGMHRYLTAFVVLLVVALLGIVTLFSALM